MVEFLKQRKRGIGFIVAALLIALAIGGIVSRQWKTGIERKRSVTVRHSITSVDSPGLPSRELATLLRDTVFKDEFQPPEPESASSAQTSVEPPKLYSEGNELVVTQSPEIQASIRDFLQLLRAPFDAHGVASNAALEARLEATRVSIDFDDLPRDQACARLEELIGVPVRFDQPPPSSTVTLDTDPLVVRLKLDQVSAASAVACFALFTETTPVLFDGMVMLCTERLERRYDCRAFDVTAIEAQKLDPVEWLKKVLPGAYTVALIHRPGRLIVRADRETLTAIALGVELLRKFCAAISARESMPTAPILPAETDALHTAKLLIETTPSHKASESRLLKQLETRVSFEFVDQPLVDAVDFIREKTGANIVIDPSIAGIVPRPHESPNVGGWIAAIFGGALAVPILYVLYVAIRTRRRPRFALRTLMAMVFLASLSVYGGVRYRKVKAAWEAYTMASTTINLRVTDMEADLALHWILRMADLDKPIRHEAICIYKRERVPYSTEVRLYYVRDLYTRIEPRELEQLIKQTVYPETWDEAIASSMRETDGILCVMQSAEMHGIIEHLLEQFRRHAGERTFPISDWTLEGDPWCRQNADWMKQKISMKMKNEPLDAILQSSQNAAGERIVQWGFNIDVEPAAQAQRVTYSSHDTPLDETLHRILAPLKLNYAVVRQGIKIGSPAYIRQRNWVLYDLADLTHGQFGTLTKTAEGYLPPEGSLQILEHQRLLLDLDANEQTLIQQQVEVLRQHAADAKP